MKVSETLLAEAAEVVEHVSVEIVEGVYACGCFGCGLGCAGTVGMD